MSRGKRLDQRQAGPLAPVSAINPQDVQPGDQQIIPFTIKDLAESRSVAAVNGHEDLNIVGTVVSLILRDNMSETRFIRWVRFLEAGFKLSHAGDALCCEFRNGERGLLLVFYFPSPAVRLSRVVFRVVFQPMVGLSLIIHQI